MSKKVTKILMALLLVVGLTACSNTKKNSDSKDLTIVTSTSTYSDISKNLVGKKGTATPILKNSSVDPHDFTPRVSDAKKVVNASIIVENGLGYDTWMNQLSNNNRNAVKINVSKDVLRLSNGKNEHIWYDINFMKRYANYLTNSLIDKDSKNDDYYLARNKEYVKKFDALEIKQSKLRKKFNGKKAYVTEPVFDRMLYRLGVKVEDYKFAKAVEEGTDPTVSEINEVQEGLKKKKVDFLVVNKQSSSNVINKVISYAKEYDVPIIYVTETMPNGLSYIEWMDQVLNKMDKLSRKI